MKRLTPQAQAEIDALCEQHGGVVRAEEIVRFARRRTTALHPYFTWDDGLAAEQYRLWQARQVLRVYVITVSPDPKVIDISVEGPIRGFLSNPADRHRPGGGYRRTLDILRDDTLRAAQLQLARREAAAFASRFRHLKELAAVIEAIDQFVEEAPPRRARGGKR